MFHPLWTLPHPMIQVLASTTSPTLLHPPNGGPSHNDDAVMNIMTAAHSGRSKSLQTPPVRRRIRAKAAPHSSDGPSSTAGGPSTTTGAPRTAASGRPKTAAGGLRTTTGGPRTAVGRPRSAVGVPRTAVGVPRTAGGGRRAAGGGLRASCGGPSTAAGGRRIAGRTGRTNVVDGGTAGVAIRPVGAQAIVRRDRGTVGDARGTSGGSRRSAESALGLVGASGAHDDQGTGPGGGPNTARGLPDASGGEVKTLARPRRPRTRSGTSERPQILPAGLNVREKSL